LMDRAIGYIRSLSPVERLRKAGVLSGNFWLATYMEIGWRPKLFYGLY
jgi:hypothetical protein